MNMIKQICAVSIALVAAVGCGVEAQDQDEADDTTVAEQQLSSGGCSGGFPISSCISLQGNNVLPDFYMNTTPDTSRYWYDVQVIRPPQSSWWGGMRRLDHQGHYGPDVVNIATLPWHNGCATTIVHLYTQGGTPHGDFTSPPACY